VKTDTLVSFGADRNRDPALWFRGNRTGPRLDGRPGESRPRTEWNDAVKAALARGLRTASATSTMSCTGSRRPP